MQTQKLSDDELWVAVKNDDLKAFNILFERYWAIISKTSFSFIKDREICAEITHDIFLNIWNRRHILEILSIRAYLITSARYHVYKREKPVRSIDLKYIEDYTSVKETTTHNTAEEHFNYNELKTKINFYLDDLPRRSKEIFLLSREEHLSNDEIANRLQISKRTVENQITYALKHLRTALKEFGILLIIFRL